jgi:hypothetical protein
MGGKTHMKHTLFAACILSSALVGSGNAQQTAASPEMNAHYTKAQVKQLVRGAHTPDQYRILASYYGEQQNGYLKQAADEKREWIRRCQDGAGVAAKYPRPVDSARNQYEYYMYKASGSGDLAAKYAELADSSNPTKVE